MTQYFHVYADGKTVREITPQEYFRKNFQGYKLAWIDDKDIGFVHGNHVSFLSRAQNRQILAAAEKQE